MGVDDFPFFDGHAFAESFQAGDDPFKPSQDISPARPENSRVDKRDHLGHVIVGGGQVAMNECKVLSRAQHVLAAAQAGERQGSPERVALHEIRQQPVLS